MLKSLKIKIEKFKRTIILLFLKKVKIKAVHEEDFIELLTSLGVKEEILTGKHFCYFCKKQITLDNLQTIIKTNKGIKFICSEPECTNKL